MLQLLWKYLRSVAGDLFDNTYDLVGLAELVVIPDIKHKVLPRSDGCKPIDYTSVGGTNEVAGDYLRGGDVGDLLRRLECRETSRRKLLTSSTSASWESSKFSTAMETFGVGTRMALPVSLPSNSGSALETAFAAPVSVKTMFKPAARPRRSPLW